MSGKTVLYAEDNADDAFFMQQAFNKVGGDYSLSRVADGRETIDYLAGDGLYADRQQYPFPSLLLLDLNLPIKSGLQILQWLQNQPGGLHLKVVVMTSSGLQVDIDQTRHLGAIDYVVKPSTPSRLADILKKGWERWAI